MSYWTVTLTPEYVVSISQELHIKGLLVYHSLDLYLCEKTKPKHEQPHNRTGCKGTNDYLKHFIWAVT